MTQSILERLSKSRAIRKSVGRPFLLPNERIWKHLPPSLKSLSPVRSYGIFLHSLVRLWADRTQNFGTFFLRNRPQLELIRRLADRVNRDGCLRISVLGCSKGAEVYSIVWTIRRARPDLKVVMHAVDISKEVLEFAQKGAYSLTTPQFVEVPIFERMSRAEMREMFDTNGDQARVQSWIKEGIIWHLGDAQDPGITNLLGTQDIVVANAFLCHMDPPDAERCLRNSARLVTPGGYIVVSGIDLDVRSKVARQRGWKPIPDLIEEIHDGDPSLRVDWPWKYWGLEPFNKKRHDWNVRYASVFQVGETAGDAMTELSCANASTGK